MFLLVCLFFRRDSVSFRRHNETLALDNNCLFVEEMTLFFCQFKIGVRQLTVSSSSLHRILLKLP